MPVLVGGERGAAEGLDSTDPGRAGAARGPRGPRGRGRRRARRSRRPQRGFRDWGARPAAERAEALRAAAARLRERRLELAALQVRECAKPWPRGRRRRLRGDRLPRVLRARGASSSSAGRDAAPGPGRAQHDALRAARRRRRDRALELPAGDPLRDDRRRAGRRQRGRPEAGRAVARRARARSSRRCTRGGRPARTRSSLLPGFGDAGAALVRDPRVHPIAFTGSSAVGLEIIRAAAETPDGQRHVKRVVAEMGGKNCVIVDADADLDEAVPAIVHSAFGYAGQKCSAAARVLVHEAIADTLDRAAGRRRRGAARRPGRRASPPTSRR